MLTLRISTSSALKRTQRNRTISRATAPRRRHAHVEEDSLTPDFLFSPEDGGVGGADEKDLESWRSHQVLLQVAQPLKSPFNTSNQRKDPKLKATFHLYQL